jgi:hypothetical protein
MTINYLMNVSCMFSNLMLILNNLGRNVVPFDEKLRPSEVKLNPMSIVSWSWSMNSRSSNISIRMLSAWNIRKPKTMGINRKKIYPYVSLE